MSKRLNPTLVVMAAGMGSRFGGLKQIEPVTKEGEIILDFSLYDAMLAGFKDVVFIIKKENEEDFRKLIDERAGKYMNISYAFQSVLNIPEGFEVPEGREKPWGTAHAVLTAKDMVKGPFAVINADDYYGAEAFLLMYDFLDKAKDNSKYSYSMVAYSLPKTLTDNGHVSRGVCQVSSSQKLQKIEERTKILRKDGVIKYEDEGKNKWIELPEDTLVSMNFWGFTNSMMTELDSRFKGALELLLETNAEKGEWYLPSVVETLLEEQKAQVEVMKTDEKWQGITYKEDKESVVSAIQSMKDKGFYPEKLWV